jgi:hypothetical protein
MENTILVANDLFQYLGQLTRLVQIDAGANTAIVISMEQPKAMYHEVVYSTIKHLPRIIRVADSSPPQLTTKAQARIDRLLPYIEVLAGDIHKMLDPKVRHAKLKEMAANSGECLPTIYNALRSYLVGGKSPYALAPNYKNCGRPRVKDMLKPDYVPTAKAPEDESANASSLSESETGKLKKVSFTLKAEDVHIMKKFIDEIHFDRKQTLAATLKAMISAHYYGEDGNGGTYPLPAGERPSYTQLRHFLLSEYTTAEISVNQRGQKNHDKDGSATLGVAALSALGPGHMYEIDAYLCDMQLTTEVRTEGVGRAVKYILVDRNTGLRPAMHLALENPSWMGAALAILNIFECKRALCDRLDIPYDENDWPAHGLMPNSIVGDRGEAKAKHSQPLTLELNVTLTLLPGASPQKKGTTETVFNQDRIFLQSIEKGYSIPYKRGQDNSAAVRTASLTFQQFERLMWLELIKANKKSVKGRYQSKEEILARVPTNSISLWNYRFNKNPSFVTRPALNVVKMALLPRANGSLTPDGIYFQKRWYKNGVLEKQGKFNRTEKAKKVVVIYDPRDSGTVWIRLSGDSTIYEATLTDQSLAFKGLTESDAFGLTGISESTWADANEANELLEFNLRKEVNKETAVATAALKAAGPVSVRRKMKNVSKNRKEVQAATNAEKIAHENSYAPAPGIVHAQPAPQASILNAQEAQQSSGPTHYDLLISNARKALSK